MTDKEKAKAYDEVREKIALRFGSNVAEEIFSKFEDSEDERVRKALIHLINEQDGFLTAINGISVKDILAWLEKQAEQKPADRVESMEHSYITPNPEFFQWIYNRLVYVHNENPNMDYMLSLKERIEDMQKSTDKVEPKFKVGDWVVTSYGKVNQVITVDEDSDGFTLDDDTYFSGSWKDSYHLWSIQDAKDGDVLVVGDEDGTGTAICGKNDDLGNNILYCCYDDENGFAINTPIALECLLHPATKEQRDLLFYKMKESGYEWDADKKELKKINSYCQEHCKGYQETGKCFVDGGCNAKREAEKIENTSPMLSDFFNAEYERGKADALQSIEWSEEDESMYTRTLGILGKCYMGTLPTKVEEELNWFKSLKERIGG